MNRFREIASIPISVSSSLQGVCTDGTNWYATDSTKLYKFNSSGTLLSSRTISSDGSTSHISGCTYIGGVLYVGSGNYPTNTLAYVMEYNPSTLAYVTEHQVSNDRGMGGFCYDSVSGHWWVTLYNNQVKEFDTSFSLLNTYTVPSGLLSGGSQNWDGIAIIDNQIYLNPHGGLNPDLMARFDIASTLVLDRWIMRPTECGQGIVWDDTNELMYLAKRDTNDAIVTAEGVDMVGVDGAYDASGVTTTSTSYVENSSGGFKAELDCEIGDIIEVSLSMIGKVSANSLRAYPDVASSNAVGLTEINNAPSLRINATGNEGEEQHTAKLFEVTSSPGVAQFSMQWRQNTSGTATCISRSIIAKKVGTVS